MGFPLELLGQELVLLVELEQEELQMQMLHTSSLAGGHPAMVYLSL